MPHVPLIPTQKRNVGLFPDYVDIVCIMPTLAISRKEKSGVRFGSECRLVIILHCGQKHNNMLSDIFGMLF